MADSEPNKYGQKYVPYVYEDMVLSNQVPPEAVERVKTLPLVGKVVITSYPKTGTTWLQRIVWLIEHDGEAKDTSDKDQAVFLRVPYLEHRPPGVPIDGVLNLKPSTFKSHLPLRFYKNQLKKGTTKFIIPIRNPKDTLVSLFWFYQCLKNISFTGSWEDFFQLYQNKHLTYGDIFDFYNDCLNFKELYPDKILMIKYEDLKRKPTQEIRRIANFLNKTLDEEVIERIRLATTFDSMKSDPMTNYSTFPYWNHDLSPFIRKGEIGDWRNYFSPEQSKLLDDAYTERLVSRGISLDFE